MSKFDLKLVNRFEALRCLDECFLQEDIIESIDETHVKVVFIITNIFLKTYFIRYRPPKNTKVKHRETKIT